MEVIGNTQDYCNACFTGEYPLPIPNGITKNEFEVPLTAKQGAL